MKREKRQKYRLIVQFLRYPLKVATVVFASIDLSMNGGSMLESITLAVSIMIVILSPIYLVIMYNIYRDIDLITLAVKLDVADTHVISRIVGQDEEDLQFTAQEERLIKEIDELREDYEVKQAEKEARRKQRRKERRKERRQKAVHEAKEKVKNIQQTLAVFNSTRASIYFNYILRTHSARAKMMVLIELL